MSDKKKYLDSNGLIRLVANVIAKLNTKSDLSHTHNDIYYTESEIDSKISTLNSSISSKVDESDLTGGNITVAEAEHAESADTAMEATHAASADTATKATTSDSATSATKATQDSSGNVITSTYETKTDATAKLAAAKAYTDDAVDALGDTYYTETEIDSKISTLNSAISGKAAASHTHTIANVTNLQSSLDALESSINGKANTSHSHSAATTSAAGFMSASDKSKLDGIASGANAYTLPSAGSSLGGVKSGGDVTISSGVITVNDDSHNHVISNVDGLQSALDAKAPSSHTHDDRYYTESEIDTQFSELIEAFDAGVEERFGNVYEKSEIDTKISALNSYIGSKAEVSHTHDDRYYTEAEVDARFDAIVGEGASTTLDTIGEISAAIEDNQDMLDTLNSAIGAKANASDLTSHTGNTTVHVTATERNNWNAAKTHADTAHAPSNAQANQNAFSNVTVGSTTIAADTTTDTLTLAGSNVTLTPDATNDKVTIGITKANVTSALGYTPPTTNTTYNVATTSANGLMSSSDKTKLNGIATGAEVNQNAFSNVVVGSTTIAADGKMDTLTLAAGSNVTLTPDATNDKVTIAATNTTYSAGTGISLSGTTFSNSGVRSVSANTDRDGISVNTNGASAEVTIRALEYRGSVGATTDWDTLAPGWWTVGQSTAFSTTYNQPVGAYAYGTLEVISNGDNILQRYTTHNNGQMWWRERFSSSNDFSSWRRAYDTVNKPSYSDVGAAASSHTHSAYVNQNAFSNVKVGDTTIAADTTTDTLTMIAGSNVTLTPSSTNDSVTIAAKDTVYTHPTTAGNKHIPAGGSSGQILRWSADGTAAWGADNNTTYSAATQSAAGLMSASDKTKLDGIANNANNYTLPAATSSALGGVKVGSNITNSSGTISLTKANVTAALGYTPPTTDTNTTYSAGTGISLSGTTFSNSGVRSIGTGSANGTISVNIGGSSADVAVKGLGSAAYTNSSAYAAASHTHNYAASTSAGGAAISMSGVTTAGSGAAYTATVSGITSLTAGTSFIMIPHTNSTTTTPTLNVNSLGAKGLRMRGSTATGTAMTASIAAWLASGRPVQVTYNGVYWVTEVTRPVASDLSGTVPVANGGVPSCTTNDNGKFLRVVDGVATWATIQNAEDVSF